MNIQNVVEVGMFLQNRLLSKGIHTKGIDPEEFKRIWKEARDETQKQYEKFGEIDWNLYDLLNDGKIT